jgi:hypothetical protein
VRVCGPVGECRANFDYILADAAVCAARSLARSAAAAAADLPRFQPDWMDEDKAI